MGSYDTVFVNMVLGSRVSNFSQVMMVYSN